MPRTHLKISLLFHGARCLSKAVSASVETGICWPIMAVIPHCYPNCYQSSSACHPEIKPTVITVTAAILLHGHKPSWQEETWALLRWCLSLAGKDTGNEDVVEPQEGATCSNHLIVVPRRTRVSKVVLCWLIRLDKAQPAPKLLFCVVLIECVTDKGPSFVQQCLFQMKPLF